MQHHKLWPDLFDNQGIVSGSRQKSSSPASQRVLTLTHGFVGELVQLHTVILYNV